MRILKKVENFVYFGLASIWAELFSNFIFPNLGIACFKKHRFAKKVEFLECFESKFVYFISMI